MQYFCDKCLHSFEFADKILFCPYCGKMLTVESIDSDHLRCAQNIVQTIETIWGKDSHLRQDLFQVTVQCIILSNAAVKEKLAKLESVQNRSGYAEFYSSVKRSQDRKTLLLRLESFQQHLHQIINKLDTPEEEKAIQPWKAIIQEATERIRSLYLALDMENTFAGRVHCNEQLTYSAQYSKNSLQSLYHELEQAFEKYKRCVENNNMFAAFASDGNYSILSTQLEEQSNDRKSTEPQKGPADLDKVLSRMRENNQLKYTGDLDEDFLPHVDAFWYGLENLCVFLDSRTQVRYDWENILIGWEEQESLQRRITSGNFTVSPKQLDDMLRLRKNFEKQIADID